MIKNKVSLKNILIVLSCVLLISPMVFAKSRPKSSSSGSGWGWMKSWKSHKQAKSNTLSLTPVEQSQAMIPQYKESDVFQMPSPQERQAFNQVARSAMPMTPEEVRRLKVMMYYSKRAAGSPVGVPPKPMLTTQIANLSPGATPPVVRLQQGFVTTILFDDVSGNPWEIESYDLGDSQSFDVQWQQGTNKLMIQPMNLYKYGNLVVNLKGLDTPIVLTLVPAEKAVDYRVDFRVPQLKPGEQPERTSSMGSNNPTLLNILNGVPPVNAKTIVVKGGNCEAWIISKKLYLRTKLSVLSPGWIAMMKNPDGTKAYEMSKTSTVLVSQYGTPIKLHLEGIV